MCIVARPLEGPCSLGGAPCLFGTLTSQEYQWDGVINIIAHIESVEDYSSLSQGKRRDLVNKYSFFVAWYYSVHRKLMLKIIVVPIFWGERLCGRLRVVPNGRYGPLTLCAMEAWGTAVRSARAEIAGARRDFEDGGAVGGGRPSMQN